MRPYTHLVVEHGLLEKNPPVAAVDTEKLLEADVPRKDMIGSRQDKLPVTRRQDQSEVKG